MSEDRGHCPDCGGSDGFHYSDCIYDGTDGPRGYYSTVVNLSPKAL